MNWRQWLAALNRAQKARSFKIGATIGVVAIGLIVFAAYAIQRGLEATEDTLGADASITQPATPTARGDGDAARGNQSTVGQAPTLDPAAPPSAAGTIDGARAATSDLQASSRAVERILAGRGDLTSLGVGIIAAVGLSIVVIWLGFFLTHLLIAAIIAGVAFPLTQYGPTQGYGWLMVGVASLAWAFNVGLAVLRLAYSPSSPMLAVARNVLDEAVRLKLTLVFIVLLMFAVATLPLLLDPDTPLRYRVQAFLQYATGGSFWLIALLTLLFGVSTVTLEQRDKIIWQTMTKPVTAWQYIGGKWLGVVGLNAILLLTCCTGVFLFTEYLRSTPAIGEARAYQPEDVRDRIVEDRLILETQVLQARVAVQPPPDLSRDDPDFQAAVREYIEGIQANDPMFAAAESAADQRQILDDMYQRVYNDLYTSEVARMRSVAPGGGRPFVIPDLGYARAHDEPLLLRYRVDAGSNAPDQSYYVTIRVGGKYVIVRECSLGYTHAAPLAPVIVVQGRGITLDDPDYALAEQAIASGELVGEFLDAGDLIEPDGSLYLEFYNGDAGTGRINPDTMSFPAGGLEVSYSHGNYRSNFVRVVAVLWIKLAFLAMLAICASTFLSFPVACLVALGTFLAAESSGFLSVALESFTLHDRQNNPLIINFTIFYVASAVTWVFEVYRDVDPIGRIVEGRLLSWASVAKGVGVLGAITATLYLVAVLTFRRRELAIYSGQ
ncbi:MAG: hypothetical protein R3B68_04105 [Phycisphaerales bacterium]